MCSGKSTPSKDQDRKPLHVLITPYLSFRGASNEYPQHMFLWRNKKNYPIIIPKYSSFTVPLSEAL